MSQRPPRPTRLSELAAVLGRDVEGDARFEVRGVAALERAGPQDLAFVRSARWAEALAASRAGALILPPGLDAGGRPAIRSPQPGLDFARAVRHLVPAVAPPPGVDERASVDAGARVHESASVGPHCAVGAGCVVGARSRLHAHVVLYPDVHVGADCVLHASCVLREGTRLGDRVVLQPGVLLGGDGFGYAPDGEGGLEKIPQVGRVVVGDDVEIGAGSTIDRGALGDTRIGSRVKIDNLVQIGHNCEIGEGAVIVAQAGLAGSTRVGRGAMIMGQAGFAGHLSVGERAFVGPQTGVHKDVPAGGRVLGTPQRPERSFHRVVAALTQLPDVIRRLRALERHLGLRPGRPGRKDGER